jgi:hypothetical protein
MKKDCVLCEVLYEVLHVIEKRVSLQNWKLIIEVNKIRITKKLK